MLSETSHQVIEKALREAIDDAWRLGVGRAIEVVASYVRTTTDPQTLQRLVEDLRRLSVT